MEAPWYQSSWFVGRERPGNLSPSMLPDEGGTGPLRLNVWCRPFPNYQRETKESRKIQGEGGKGEKEER